MHHSSIANPVAPEAISSIGSGLSIVGKIVGHGTLAIFGRVEGELRASAIQAADGAQVEGDIFSEELTIGGRVNGTIHANRVKLTSTAVVEGDTFHRSLAIEENAQSRHPELARIVFTQLNGNVLSKCRTAKAHIDCNVKHAAAKDGDEFALAFWILEMKATNYAIS